MVGVGSDGSNGGGQLLFGILTLTPEYVISSWMCMIETKIDELRD